MVWVGFGFVTGLLIGAFAGCLRLVCLVVLGLLIWAFVYYFDCCGCLGLLSGLAVNSVGIF